MKPIYFCTNCKQYHAVCQKQTLSHSSSVKFLRFSDLFNAVPQAHPQNFTVNSHRNTSFNRLVYDNDSSIVGRNKDRNNRIISNKYVNRSQYYIKDSKATISDKPSTSTDRKHSKTAHRTIYLSISKQKLKTEPQQQTTIILKGNYNSKKKSQQTPSSKKGVKGPYFVISKYGGNSKIMGSQKNRENQWTKNGKQKTVETTIISDRKTPVKNSYVYGDSNRKILTSGTDFTYLVNNGTQATQGTHEKYDNGASTKPVKEWKFGELVESRQSEDHRKEQKTQIKANKDQDQGDSVLIKEAESKFDYGGKMWQLKQILKSNQKKYSNLTYSNKKQSSQIQLPLVNQQPQKSMEKPTAVLHQLQPFRPTLSPSSCHPNLSSSPNPHSRSPIPAPFFQCNTEEVQKCKYFDNRCLGFNFCEQGEINYIKGSEDLL